LWFNSAGSNLVTHARDALTTARKPTAVVSARARQREAAKLKKEEEKSSRREEVRRLKALKRKQVEEKLVQLVEAAGGGAKGLEEIDLDGDWDEARHEEEMKKIYGGDYEGAEDEGFKPTWDDEIDITDIVGDGGGDSDDDNDRDMNIPFASTSALTQEEDEMEEEQENGKKNSKKDKKKKKEQGGARKDEEGFPVALMEKAKAGGDEESKKMLERLEEEYYGIEYEDKVSFYYFSSLVLLCHLTESFESDVRSEESRLDSDIRKLHLLRSTSLRKRSFSQPMPNSTHSCLSRRSLLTVKAKRIKRNNARS